MTLQMPETFKYEKRGKIAIMTVNRPKAMNSFTEEMLAAMDAAFEDFRIFGRHHAGNPSATRKPGQIHAVIVDPVGLVDNGGCGKRIGHSSLHLDSIAGIVGTDPDEVVLGQE